MKKINIVPKDPQYRVVEIFESLQGGGWGTDMPAAFVRLDKHNLACGWCDTNHLKFGMMSLSNILGRLKTYAARNIIITGDEPTIQPYPDTLPDAPGAEGYFLCIETNGLKPTPPQIDYIAASPKACYTAKYETNCIIEADGVRIVADGDVVTFCENMEHKIRARHYYPSPYKQNSVMSIYGAIRQIGLLNNHPDVSVHWQLSVQMHRWAGIE